MDQVQVLPVNLSGSQIQKAFISRYMFLILSCRARTDDRLCGGAGLKNKEVPVMIVICIIVLLAACVILAAAIAASFRVYKKEDQPDDQRR